VLLFVDRYLLAGKSMPWYAMALSIMATQASAITFISTTGQSYVDGMRFVQFYFGLPIAMVVISATVVPVFHHARVYTAYEYLEQRFDSKTRALGSLIFLCQRGLSAGLTIYAPALRSTLERFGIPARFYFDTALERHAVVRFLSGAIDAMLGGWDHARTLAVLMLAFRSFEDGDDDSGNSGQDNSGQDKLDTWTRSAEPLPRSPAIFTT
jgi:uncharacterized sodium:solute symporter family permease YidK